MPESLYLTDVLILLAAAVLAVPLFQHLRLGTVPGFLAAGATIGPWGLGFIDEVEEIRHLAEFGVVFLLFVIGIELKPSRLWVMRRSVFGLGTTQVLVTGALLSWLAMAFGVPKHTSLVVGFGLALSSTAFGIQILAEKGDLRTAYGRTAFAILLLQDLAVVPLIALVPLLADRTLSLARDVELAALETLLILLGVLLMGRFMLRPLLNLVAGIRIPEVFVATALLVVLGTGWLTERAGLSMGLGAFLAGILLSDSRYRHQILADIQPFRGMLLGLFFMTVGMSIDFGLLGREATQVAGLVGGLLLVKAALLWALCRAAGRSHGESLHVALLLPQGGEFGFVIFGLASGVGVMTGDLYQLLVLVVVMSMVLTPPLFKLASLLGPLPPNTLPRQESARERIPESHNHVILAGFGRFGQEVARVLSKAGVTYRALDINPARVTEGRAHGCPVYYGDASRLDVLRAAGAANAALVVFAADNMEAIARGAAALEAAYPSLPVFARVTDPRMGQRLRKLGLDQAFPETLETSLRVAGEILHALSIEPETANRLVETARRRAHERVSKDLPAMGQRRYQDILLASSSESDLPALLEEVAELAEGSAARLTVTEVFSALPGGDGRGAVSRLPDAETGTPEAHCRQSVDKRVATLRERIEVASTVHTGKPHLAIIREVLRGGHDLLVKTAEPRTGTLRNLIQNTDLQLLRKCPCPVWFVRPQPCKPYRRILAAVEADHTGSSPGRTGGALGRQVLEAAHSLALIELSELHVVHVWQPYGEDILRSGRSPFPQWDTDAYIEREQRRHQEALHALLAQVRGSGDHETLDDVKTQAHLVNGDPRVEIPRLAQSLDVDLLVIGTAVPTGLNRFMLANTAEAIFSGLKCSMLVLKPPDFVTSFTVED